MADDHTLIREALERDNMMAWSPPWLRGAVSSLLADLDRLVREREEAREVLREAVEFAEEGWGYAHDYYKQKWGFEDTIGRLRAVAAAQTEGKP